MNEDERQIIKKLRMELEKGKGVQFTSQPPPENLEALLEERISTYLKDVGLTWQDLSGKRTLEVGAGLAPLAEPARTRGIDMVFLDSHGGDHMFPLFPEYQPEWWIRNGKPPKDLVVADAEDLPFQAETFDFVITHGLMIGETVNNLRRSISEAIRVLKPGGSLHWSPGTFGAALFFPLYEERVHLLSEERLKSLHQHVADSSLDVAKHIYPPVSRETVQNNDEFPHNTIFLLRNLQKANITGCQNV